MMTSVWPSARLIGGVLLALAIGCPKPPEPEPITGGPVEVLEQARARPVPDPARARFTVKLRSKPLDVAGTTTGGLVVDRPGQARIELFGPIGGSPLFTAVADGAGLSVLLAGQERHLVATDAEVVLREATGGVAGLDDALALLVGDLPFDEAEVTSIERVQEPIPGVRAVLAGPEQTTIEILIDEALATPRVLVARGPQGEALLAAQWEEYAALEDGTLAPGRFELLIPALDLTVNANYRNWEALAESPAVFSVTVPETWSTESLESVLRDVAGRVTTP